MPLGPGAAPRGKERKAFTTSSQLISLAGGAAARAVVAWCGGRAGNFALMATTVAGVGAASGAQGAAQPCPACLGGQTAPLRGGLPAASPHQFWVGPAEADHYGQQLHPIGSVVLQGPSAPSGWN